MATLAVPEPVAEPTRPEPEAAARAPRRRRRPAPPRPPERIDPRYLPAAAPDEVTTLIAAADQAGANFERLRQEALVDAAAEYRDDFASTDARRHGRAARRLAALKDDALAALQRTWRTTLKRDFYAFLFDRSAQGTTAGIEEALSVLRRAFVRDAAMQKDFGDAYAAQRLIEIYAWQLRTRFMPRTIRAAGPGESGSPGTRVANVDDAQALAVLRDQTPGVRAAIVATFRARYHVDPLDWLIDEVPRTEASVRAIAILRTGDDRAAHVELGAVLIPPQNANRKLPVQHLRVKLSERRLLEQTYNDTFTGVGHHEGLKTPDTLRGHLAKLGGLVGNLAPYHEALMLLHHDLTDAERLYIHVTRWARTDNDSALDVARDLIRRGVGRKRLEEDWNLYVRDAEGVATRGFFTDLTLREHLDAVYRFKGTETKGHLLALLDQLDRDDDEETADLAPETRAKDRPRVAWGIEKDVQDRARWNAEDRRLRAAYAVIDAVQGRFAANDKAILDALGEIAELLRARIARLDARAAEVRAREDLAPRERESLVAHYEAEAARARADDAARRARLTRRIVNDEGSLLVTVAERIDSLRPGWTNDHDVDQIRMSRSERAAARLTLSDAPTPADRVWIAIHRNDWEELVTIVTQVWAKGGIDALHAGAAKPGVDALGIEVRPVFSLFTDMARMRGTLPYRRVFALSMGHVSDAKRGVARIVEEMKEGSTGPDLAPILALLGHRDLKPALRQQVLEAFADFETGGSGLMPGETAAGFFLAKMAAHFEGVTANWRDLRDLLVPAANAEERRERARERRAPAQHGRLAWVSEAAARAWSTLSGDYLYEAEARSEDRLEFIRTATDEQLAPLMALAGVTKREELSALEAETFNARHGDVQATENMCATLIAGFVETLVEAGLAPLTGGAGLAAVMGAAVAAMASMAAQEAMLGPDYKLISGENFNAVLQSALGTALTELDLRSVVLKAAPFKSLDKHVRTQQTLQNAITGAIELTTTAATEIATNVLVREKWPTDDDIAKQADLLLGRIVAKGISTQATVDYHPGKVRAYTRYAAALKNNVIFKLAIKVTEAGAKEIVSVVTTGARDQTFADQVLQVLWKEARGVASVSARTALSTAGGRGTAHGGRVLVDEMRAKDPALFGPLLRSILKKQYDESAELKAEHDAERLSGRRRSTDQFMLDKLRAKDKPGENRAEKLQSGVEKELLAYAELMTGKETGRQGVLAYRTPSAGIQGIAEQELAPPAPHPELADRGIARGVRRVLNAEDHDETRRRAEEEARRRKQEQDRLPLAARLAAIQEARRLKAQHEADAAGAHGAPATAAPVPHAPIPLSSLRMTALLKEHSRLSPEHFADRAELVAEVLEGTTPLARGVRAGDAASLTAFAHRHGDWGQTIQILQTLGAGPEAAALGFRDHTRRLQAERNALAHDLERLFGATASKHASTEATSDLDLAIKGENAPERRRKAEEYMLARSKEHWRSIWNLSFFGDDTSLTRYADHAQLVPAEERSATQLRLTNLTEHYAFTRMLHLAQQHARPDVEHLVENLAASLGHDLSVARQDTARLAPHAARERLHELGAEIERVTRQLDTDEHDPAVTPEQRFRRATHLSELTMEANFLTKEANIGPGANRALLQGVQVKGPEAFQAFMTHMLMYVEHKVEPGSHRTYAPPKYIARMVGTIESAGVGTDALQIHGQIATHVYRRDRYANSKGGPRRDMELANTEHDVLAEAAGFEQAVLKPAAALKLEALKQLDVVAPAPAPAAAPPAKTPEARGLPAAPAPDKPMRREPVGQPATPAGFVDRQQFFERLRDAVEDREGSFATALAKRKIALDEASATPWLAFLLEQAATSLGNPLIRDDLRVMNAALRRLKEPSPEP